MTVTTLDASPGAKLDCTPADVVRRAQDGDQTALASIAACAEPRVRAVVRRFRFDSATAEDVIQNTMLRMLTRIGTLRMPERFDAWIKTIARNEAISVVRGRSREIPSDVTDGQLVLHHDPATDMMRLEDISAVRNAVAQLPEKSQQLMGLLFAEDKVCYDDVARKIGRPKGSIGPTRQRCLARLLEILEAEPAQRTA